jgi:transcription-repair coupling factor (superfamily II helicase)
MLVIDEEQRFGVAHKEQLRKLRMDVDVLVMTATPIPRTLNQALLGIRDVSALSEAPRGRRGVHSEVVPFSEDLIRQAILLELDRGGQTYLVHNRVQSIERLAKRVRDLVPAARVLVGHGQMPEKQLEQTMLDFIEGRADVLVATTIIESGLDIPRANTLIVDQAHLYGLADLHQLRGRVGRQNVDAVAWFLLRPEDHPTEEAEKRLRAIEEFSNLGAGFQIAMRDMEIRGAGNILGAEQSGHIATVGYELYCRLLENAVKGLKGQSADFAEDVELNLDFTAFIPDSYVSDTRQRIDVYRMLSRCNSESDFHQMLLGLRDRFGPPPASVSEFVLLSRIRGYLERAKVSKLELLPGEGVILTPRRYRAFLESLRPGPLGVRLLSNKTVLLVQRKPFATPRELLQFLEEALLGVVSQ